MRWVATGIIGLVLIAPSMVVMQPTSAAPPAATQAEFVLASYLGQSSALRGMRLDLGGLATTVTSYTAKNQRFESTGTLGYKSSDVINRSPRDQTTTTLLRTITATHASSYENTHTVDFGYEVSTSASVDIKFFEGEWSTKTSVGYSFSNKQTWSDTVQDTLTMSAQNVVVPAGHSARIEEWYDQGRFSADVEIVGRVTGPVLVQRCGVSAYIPIGQLLAQRGAVDMPPLPDWIRPVGDAVEIRNTVSFRTERATTQVIRITAEPIGGAGPTSTTTLGRAGAIESGPITYTKPTRAMPKVYIETNIASLLGSLVNCPTTTSDGTALLTPGGSVYAAQSGARLALPDDAAARSVSGFTRGGQTFVSAIDYAGRAHWYNGNSFVRLDAPLQAVQTADGGALLGSDGLIYDAVTGAVVPSPPGVRFSDVSVAAGGGTGAISAITSDGRVYFTSQGRLERVGMPTTVLDTVDGAILLGVDGNAYRASDGSRISNPSGTEFNHVSARVDSGRVMGYSATDLLGNSYWADSGRPFTRLPRNAWIVETFDGIALAGDNGAVYSASSGELFSKDRPGWIFGISAASDSGQLLVSLVGDDGTPYVLRGSTMSWVHLRS